MFRKQKNQKAVCEEGAHSRRPRGCQWGAGWAAEKWEPSLGQEVGWGAGGRGSVGSWAGADPCSPGAPESRRPEPARRGRRLPRAAQTRGRHRGVGGDSHIVLPTAQRPCRVRAGK